MAIPIPLSHVLDNPWNTREVYAEDHVAEVADSIRRLGQLQPALGRLVHVVDGKPYPEDVADDLTLSSKSAVGALLKKGARVQLAFGHTRARALGSLGSPVIEVTLKRLSDEEMADLAWAENRDRKDLNPVEEARALQRAAETFGYTHDQLAERRGLARPTVSNKLRLLRLPAPILNALGDGRISEGRARALLPAYDAKERHPEAWEGDLWDGDGDGSLLDMAQRAQNAEQLARWVADVVEAVEEDAAERVDESAAGPAEAPAVPAAPEAAPPEIEQQAATEAAEEDDYDEPAWYAVERAVRAVLGTVPEPARRLLSNLLIDRERSGDWLGPAWVWGAAMTILREMESAYPSSPREAAEAWGVEVDWSEADVSAETSEHTLIEPSAGARHEVEEGGIPPESVEVSREAVIEEVGAHLAAAREARRLMRHKAPKGKSKKKLEAEAEEQEHLAEAKLEQFAALASPADVRAVCDALHIPVPAGVEMDAPAGLNQRERKLYAAVRDAGAEGLLPRPSDEKAAEALVQRGLLRRPGLWLYLPEFGPGAGDGAAVPAEDIAAETEEAL